MIHRTAIITGLLLSSTAIFAADADASLQATKQQLTNQVCIKLTPASDGTLLKYNDELNHMVASIEPFSALIGQAKTAEECQLIQQKLNLATTLIRNRSIFGGQDPKTLYSEIIPNILALATVTSRDDVVLQIAGELEGLNMENAQIVEKQQY
jgi:hypothetical protein